jgi:hypothetical protein
LTRRNRAAIASAVTLSFLLAVDGALVGGCIDGTTPDCSSPTSGCAPDLDGSVGADAADGADTAVDAIDASDAGSDAATKDVAADGDGDAKAG